MTEQINILELLKSCPKGTKLHSLICGECELDEIAEGNIFVLSLRGKHQLGFDEQGHNYAGGECLLFPSKEVRDWGCFRVKYIKFVDSVNKNYCLQELLGIKTTVIREVDERYKSFIGYVDNFTKELVIEPIDTYKGKYILSTGTELKLEEEQPKFKVGDAVKYDNVCHIIAELDGIRATIDKLPTTMRGVTHIDNLTLATPSAIAKWNKEVLHPNHLHYSKSKRKIIHWFLTFDKVVVRNGNDDVWMATLYSYHKANSEKHVTIYGRHYTDCLPYNEETAKLIGTTKDFDNETQY